MLSYYVAKLCVYQLKEMHGLGSAIRIVDINEEPPVLPDMTFDFSVYVFDETLRPIGVNMKEFYMDHKKDWPYYITNYQLEFNPVDVKDKENRQRFIAYTNEVDNTIPLYLYQTPSDGFYLSLTTKVPEDLVPAFNPAIYVMSKPYEGFKCTRGVVSPTDEPDAQAVYKVLETCREETDQEMIKNVATLSGFNTETPVGPGSNETSGKLSVVAIITLMVIVVMSFVF